MNVSHTINYWSMGGLLALSVAACDPVDHLVGAENEGSLDGAGGNDGTGGSVSGTGGSVSGTGGSDNTTGAAAAGAAGATAGGAGNGVWGDLPIPESCTTLSSSHDETECQLEVACADGDVDSLDLNRISGAPVSSHCWAVGDSFNCDCVEILGGVPFNMTGVTVADACPHALAACLSWRELEASPFECIENRYPEWPPLEEPDSCQFSERCTREGVIGDASFTEGLSRDIECSEGPSGWTCECFAPRPDVRFEFPASDAPCLDARDWCLGDDVEFVAEQTCALTSQNEEQGTCVANVECQRAVTLSGQEATMYSDESIYCRHSDTGGYLCKCKDEDPLTPVAAEDLLSACTTAASLCWDT